jgi:hypothetical protein
MDNIDFFYQTHIRDGEGLNFECGHGGLGGIVFPCDAGWTRQKVAALIKPTGALPGIFFAVPTAIRGADNWLEEWISDNMRRHGNSVYLPDSNPWFNARAYTVSSHLIDIQNLPKWVNFGGL